METAHQTATQFAEQVEKTVKELGLTTQEMADALKALPDVDTTSSLAARLEDMAKRKAPKVEAVAYTVNGRQVVWTHNAHGWVVTAHRGSGRPGDNTKAAVWASRPALGDQPAWRPQRPSMEAAMYYWRRADQRALNSIG